MPSLRAATLLLLLAACGGVGSAPPPSAPAGAPASAATATSSTASAASAARGDDVARRADPADAALPTLAQLGPVPPPPSSPAEALAAARAEFEVAAPDLAGGTSKLYARSDFLPLDDPRGMATGDFVGRLRALFGEVPEDEYVLRHRATGAIVTAYAAQSGPSYGGAGPLAVDAEGAARFAAVRALPNPRDSLTKPLEAMTPAEMLAYRKADHAYRRAIMDARAHPVSARLVARLDALVSAVPPADWKVIRYWGEDPTVTVDGAADGKAFSGAMKPAEGLAYLLGRAERGEDGLLDASQGPDDADLQVVAYWGYHMGMQESASARPQLERARARVQRAWFRLVERAHGEDAGTREYLLALAGLHAPPLRLDPVKAAAALAGAGR